MAIPKDVQHVFEGRGKLHRNLETESKTEAEHLVLKVVSEWKLAIRKAKQGRPQEALAEYHKAQRATLPSDEDRDAYDEHVLLEIAEQISERNSARLNEEDKDSKAVIEAKEFYSTATGNRTYILDHVDAWLDEKKKAESLKEKAADEYKAAINAVAKHHKLLEHVGEKEAIAIVTEWLTTVKVATIRKRLAALRGYWSWLIGRKLTDSAMNPWKVDFSLPSRSKTQSAKDQRKAFDDDALKKLLAEIDSRNDTILKDLLLLDMFTGARIEELCALEIRSVYDDHLSIEDAKSVAGIRDIPIHPYVKPVVDRLVDSSIDGYLLSGLKEDKYGRRSGAIGKRFGRVKKDLGFGSDYVFHSIRKSVAGKFKAAGVNEAIAAEIVGHELNTMTYGLYADGLPMEVKRKALNKISYDFILEPIE